MPREVSVRRHERRVRGVLREVRRHRRVIKVHGTKGSTRIRLEAPGALRKRGYRFRTVPPGKAKGLTKAERDAIRRAHGKVVLGVRGPSVGRRAKGFRVQAIVVPREG